MNRSGNIQERRKRILCESAVFQLFADVFCVEGFQLEERITVAPHFTGAHKLFTHCVCVLACDIYTESGDCHNVLSAKRKIAVCEGFHFLGFAVCHGEYDIKQPFLDPRLAVLVNGAHSVVHIAVYICAEHDIRSDFVDQGADTADEVRYVTCPESAPVLPVCFGWLIFGHYAVLTFKCAQGRVIVAVIGIGAVVWVADIVEL